MLNNNEYQFVDICRQNMHLVEKFLEKPHPFFFRYFKTRSIQVLKNHKLTVILLHKTEPVGYAHIDRDEKENNWFGICILEPHTNKGLGKKMIEYVMEHPLTILLDHIFLSVDKTNDRAIHLYRSFGFSLWEEESTHFKMTWNRAANLSPKI